MKERRERERELTIKQRRIQPAAPGNRAYQKLSCCILAPSMNSIGKLAAVNITIKEQIHIHKQITNEPVHFRIEWLRYNLVGASNRYRS